MGGAENGGGCWVVGIERERGQGVGVRGGGGTEKGGSGMVGRCRVCSGVGARARVDVGRFKIPEAYCSVRSARDEVAASVLVDS